MTVLKLFPRLLVVCFAFLLTAGVAAQSSENDSRKARTTIDSDGAPRLENEIAVPPVEESRPRMLSSKGIVARFDQLLLSAMQSHLGSTYRYTGTGPDSFDCSGFVWRSFQDIGLNFQRGPARSYWATFAAPAKGEEFKFGNLVFFSGLAHVGIVADERGFYHSSRHHGVIYSPFSEYWLSRIDGFRRVSMDLPAPLLNQKARAAKPVAPIVSVEENNQR